MFRKLFVKIQKAVENLEEPFEHLGIVLLIWAIISAGLIELFGTKGIVYGVIATGLVIYAVRVFTKQ